MAAYERGRPGYPAAAVEELVRLLGIGPGATVLDLAAGSGKLTRQLVPAGAALLAVEPSAAMRDRLAGAAGVRVLAGTAEAIPVAAGAGGGALPHRPVLGRARHRPGGTTLMRTLPILRPVST